MYILYLQTTGNKEKDLAKDFEKSYTRVFVIMIITYLALWAYMVFLGVSNPNLHAVVPTVGFNFSTWTLVPIKYCWTKFYNPPIPPSRAPS